MKKLLESCNCDVTPEILRAAERAAEAVSFDDEMTAVLAGLLMLDQGGIPIATMTKIIKLLQHDGDLP